MFSATDYDGYAIWMKAFANLWVKDTTRTLIIEKARPSQVPVSNIRYV